MQIKKDAHFEHIKLALELLNKHKEKANEQKSNDHAELLNLSSRIKKATAELFKQYNSPFAFCRITDVLSQEGEYLFGTKFKVKSYKLVEVNGAKLENGEWVVDEGKVIAHFKITDEMLAKTIVSNGGGRHEGYPISFTQVADTTIAAAQKPFIDANDQYSEEFKVRFTKISQMLSELKLKIEELADTDCKLNKTNQSEAIKKVEMLTNMLSSDMSFDLDNVAKMMTNDMNSIYVSIISNINAVLTHGEQKPALSNPYAAGGTVQDIFDFSFGSRSAKLVADLMKDLERFETATRKEQYKEKTAMNSLYDLKSFYEDFSAIDYPQNNIQQGIISLSSTSQGFTSFFGDSKHSDSYVSFCVQWGRLEGEKASRSRYAYLAGLVDFRLTPTQYLEFIQSTATKQWVKCTVDRFMSNSIDRSALGEEEHEDVPVTSVLSEGTLSLVDQISQQSSSIIELLSNNSQSKAKRESLVINLNALETLIGKYTPMASKDAELSILKVNEKVVTDTLGQINISLGNILERKPQLAGEIKQLLPNLKNND